MINPTQYGLVALIYGGVSAEREVSLRSGKAVGDALTRLGIHHTVIDASGKDLVRALLACNYDRAFIVLHGGDGEDGHVQALLEVLGVPHTGSKMLANALAMDKLLTKELWQKHDLPTPKSMVLGEQLDIGDLRYPLAVKPSTQGSSVGISKVKSVAELLPAYQYAKQYGVVMAEEWIQGDELTVTVVGDQVLPSVRIQPKNEYYDYDAKYTAGTSYYCPSGLSDVQEQMIHTLAKQAYDVLGCAGCARIDFIQCAESKQFYLIEANTVPGMTEHSLVPKSAKVFGWSFDQLVLKMLEQTL